MGVERAQVWVAASDVSEQADERILGEVDRERPSPSDVRHAPRLTGQARCIERRATSSLKQPATIWRAVSTIVAQSATRRLLLRIAAAEGRSQRGWPPTFAPQLPEDHA